MTSDLRHLSTAEHARRPCVPGSRCHNWRNCDTCAHIRSAHVASIVARMQSLYPTMLWSIIEPDHAGPAALTEARRSWARTTAAPAGVWSCEQSPSGRLHANIIHPPTPYIPRLPAAHIITTEITGDACRVAAYMTKRAQAPDPITGPRRCWGTLGPLWAALASHRQTPLVAAAAWQLALKPPEAPQPEPRTPPRAAPPVDRPWSEYRAIAMAHLPDLLALARSARGPAPQTPPPTRPF